VTGPPHLRFYAGRPISTASGHRVGTLCIAGPEPREISGEELSANPAAEPSLLGR
jgi:phosphoserine phosphatase RsbU/P